MQPPQIKLLSVTWRYHRHETKRGPGWNPKSPRRNRYCPAERLKYVAGYRCSCTRWSLLVYHPSFYNPVVLQALLSSRERNNIRNAVTQRDKKLGEASLSPPYALFFIPQQVMALSHLLPLFKMVPVLRKYCIADHLFSWVGPARRGWAITGRSLPVFFAPLSAAP